MSKLKFSLPSSTKWLLLIGMASLVTTILNTDNPIMRYYNVPRNLLLSEGTTMDYVYIAGLGLILLVGSLSFNQALTWSIRQPVRHFKWWRYGLVLLLTVILVVGTQGFMALYPDPDLELVPDTTMDLQYLNLSYWALIAVVNLAFFAWAWGLAMASSRLLAFQQVPVMIQIVVGLVIFALARLMNLDGSYGYQLVINLLMAWPLLSWSVYTRRFWLGLATFWVVYEAVIYLLFVMR